MFVIFIGGTILLTWRYADWRNWKKYLPTMQFFTIGGLLYLFLYHRRYLWQFKEDIIKNPDIIAMIFNFIVFPLTALLFLSNYPNRFWKQAFHNLKYIIFYLLIEWFYLKVGRFEHNYGWNLWWSAAWDSLMFPLLALHHKNPLLAYGASFLFVIATLLIFPIK